MTLIITPSTVAAITGAPTFAALLGEYAAESANRGLPPPMVHLDRYPQLEAAGVLHPIAAILDNELIGFISVLVSVLTHYGISIAVSESYFVANAHRHTLAGLKLLVAAEEKTRALGAHGIYVSSPTGGALDKILERAGYGETNRIFFKRVNFDA